MSTKPKYEGLERKGRVQKKKVTPTKRRSKSSTARIRQALLETRGSDLNSSGSSKKNKTKKWNKKKNKNKKTRTRSITPKNFFNLTKNKLNKKDIQKAEQIIRQKQKAKLFKADRKRLFQKILKLSETNQKLLEQHKLSKEEDRNELSILLQKGNEDFKEQTILTNQYRDKLVNLTKRLKEYKEKTEILHFQSNFKKENEKEIDNEKKNEKEKINTNTDSNKESETGNKSNSNSGSSSSSSYSDSDSESNGDTKALIESESDNENENENEYEIEKETIDENENENENKKTLKVSMSKQEIQEIKKKKRRLKSQILENQKLYKKRIKKIQRLEKRMKKALKKKKKEELEIGKSQKLNTLQSELKKKIQIINDIRCDLLLKREELNESKTLLSQKKRENSKNLDLKQIVSIKEQIKKKQSEVNRVNLRIKSMDEQKKELLRRIDHKNNEKVEEDLITIKLELNQKSEFNNQLRLIKNKLIAAVSEQKDITSEDPMKSGISYNSESNESDFDESDKNSKYLTTEPKRKRNQLKNSYSFDTSQKNVPLSNNLKNTFTQSVNNELSKKMRKSGERPGIMQSNQSNRSNEETFYNEKHSTKIKENEDSEKSEEKDKLIQKGEGIIEIETIDSLFSIPIAIEYFKEFMFEQLNQENLLFYLDVVNFKKTCSIDKKRLKKVAKTITYKYIKNESIFEINIDSKCRSNIIEQVKNGDFEINMFDQAKQIVYVHMNLNSFEEFKKSKLYQNFLEKAQSSKSYKFKPIKTATLTARGYNKDSLNIAFKFKGRARPGLVVSKQLISTLIELISAHYSTSEKEINLQLLSESIPFKKFIDQTIELQKIKLRSMNDLERKIFFINVYNVLLMHSIIINELSIASLSSSSTLPDLNLINNFLKNSKYIIGGMAFSLIDISEGIFCKTQELLKNSKKNGSYFQENDQRNKYIVNFDKRVFFALNDLQLGTFSLFPYDIKNMDDQLNKITKTVLKWHSHILEKSKKIVLPNVFKNYARSFGKKRLKFLNWIIQNVLPNQNTSGFSIKFSNYNPYYTITFDSKYSQRKFDTFNFKEKYHTDNDNNLKNTTSETNHQIFTSEVDSKCLTEEITIKIEHDN
ncbi:electron carrier/ protein disulfide oxidoreductase [Anaeramoeba flamelloides]|uniref:Electron carrier/ protein disulfide oxidoreductase n=1 Tax=Anaeramoeba flamelloides TaxID=1746091 RepID=A0AAV8AF62_9EUKA|nr:electron carrier/ protein disulfide oxidoreductase [Anaeramoeba flamelloides]